MTQEICTLKEFEEECLRLASKFEAGNGPLDASEVTDAYVDLALSLHRNVAAAVQARMSSFLADYIPSHTARLSAVRMFRDLAKIANEDEMQDAVE